MFRMDIAIPHTPYRESIRNVMEQCVPDRMQLCHLTMITQQQQKKLPLVSPVMLENITGEKKYVIAMHQYIKVEIICIEIACSTRTRT